MRSTGPQTIILPYILLGINIIVQNYAALEIYVDPKIFINSKYLEFRGKEFVRVTFREEISTEAEEIGFWIQTKVGDGLLFSTTSYRGQSTYLELSLIESSLKISLNFGAGPIVFRQGDNLSDGEWHYVLFKRYGQRMEIRLNDQIPEIYTLPASPPDTPSSNASSSRPAGAVTGAGTNTNPVLRYRAIDIAYKPQSAALAPPPPTHPRGPAGGTATNDKRHGFVGKMRGFTFNSLKLFDILSGGGGGGPVTGTDNGMDHKLGSISIDSNIGPSVAAYTTAKSGAAADAVGADVVYHKARADSVGGVTTTATAANDGYGPFVAQPITFNTAETFLTLPKPAQDIKMNIYFRFRTTASAGIVFYYEGIDMEFLCIELVKGHINYVFNFGSGPQLLRSSTIHKLDDNRWHEVTVSKTNINDHVLIVDFSVSKTISQDAKFKFFDGHSGTIYVGGVPEQILNFPPGLVQSKLGFQGCLASLNINGWEPDLLIDSLFKFQPPQLEPGCNGPKEQCLAASSIFGTDPARHGPYKREVSRALCGNGGTCLQHWDSWSCDCTLTGFAGPRCSEYGAAFRFGTVPSLHSGPRGIGALVGVGGGIVSYYFPTYDQSDSGSETVALGFATAHADADIMSVRSSHSNDYLEIGLRDGYLFVITDLGDGEKSVTLRSDDVFGHKNSTPPGTGTKGETGGDDVVRDEPGLDNLADGAYHVINYLRRGNNMTLKVDGYSVSRSFPQMGGKEAAVFNSVAEIYVGGSSIYKRKRRRRSAAPVPFYGWDRRGSDESFQASSRVRRAPKPHFIGLLSAVSFNGLMVLEEALRGNSNIFVEGDVEKVVSVLDELRRLALLTTTTSTTFLTSKSSNQIFTSRTTMSSSLVSGVISCNGNGNQSMECVTKPSISTEHRLISSIMTKSPTLNKRTKLKGLQKTLGIKVVDDDDTLLEDDDGSGSGYPFRDPYPNEVHTPVRSQGHKIKLSGTGRPVEPVKLVSSTFGPHILRDGTTLMVRLRPISRSHVPSPPLAPTIRILGAGRKTTLSYSLGVSQNRNNLVHPHKYNNRTGSVLLYPTKPKAKKGGSNHTTTVPTTITQQKANNQQQLVPRRKSPVYNFFNPKQSKLFILICSIVATVLIFVCCVSLCCCICAHRRRQRQKLVHKEAISSAAAAGESLLPDFGKDRSGLLVPDEKGSLGKKSILCTPKPNAATTIAKCSNKSNKSIKAGKNGRPTNHYARSNVANPTSNNSKKSSGMGGNGSSVGGNTKVSAASSKAGNCSVPTRNNSKTTMMKFSKSEDAVYQNLNATTGTEDEASSILFDSYTLPRVDTSENSTIMSRIDGDTFSNKYAAGVSLLAPGSTKWPRKSKDHSSGPWPGSDKGTMDGNIDSESDNSSVVPLSAGENSMGRCYKETNGKLLSSSRHRSERKPMLVNATNDSASSGGGKPMKEWYV